MIWADRKPLERKWILLPTMLVGIMLLVAVVFSLLVGVVLFGSVVGAVIALPLMVTLWGFSYFNACGKKKDSST